MSMNADIATACATRPEERARQNENLILNEFDQTLADLRTLYGYAPGDEDLSAGMFHEIHRARRTQMNIEIARVAARCSAAGLR